jgi:hypothetical protein
MPCRDHGCDHQDLSNPFGLLVGSYMSWHGRISSQNGDVVAHHAAPRVGVITASSQVKSYPIE